MSLGPTSPVPRSDVKGATGMLREVQTRPAAEPIDAVARAIEPDLILGLDGYLLVALQRALGVDRFAWLQRPLLGLGRRHGRPWVIGMHPGGAQRRGWGADAAYAARIIAAVEKLGP